MFKLYANKNNLTLLERERVTSGSVNVYQVRFDFSEDWAELDRTAVFRCGGKEFSMLLDASGRCVIPWEVLQKPGFRLEVGAYGSRGGETVLPTVWESLGTVLTGVNASEGSAPPTPELWQQTLAGKGDRLGYTESGELGLYAGEKLLSAVPASGGGGGMSYGIGHGLKVENGDLTVETTDGFAGDNTLPMTAAGVETVVGNIEVLLGTI